MSIYSSFAASIGADRDGPRVLDRDGPVTASQLLALADELGRVAGRQDLDGIVGLMLERDRFLPAWILALDLIGVPWLPLDPAWPDGRIRQCLDAAGCHAVVGADRPGLGSLDITRISPDGQLLTKRAADCVSFSPTEHLQYILFTSGSSGAPKAVAVRRAGIDNLLSALDDMLGEASSHVWLSSSTLAFDAAVIDLIWPLSRGATLRLVPDSAKIFSALDPASIQDDLPVTHLFATPSLLRLLMHDPRAAGGVWAADRLLCGGEPLPAELAERVLDHADRKSGQELWNLYGPTEGTVFATRNLVLSADGAACAGTPIANVSVEIERIPRRADLAEGVGEVVLGGAGVADGYWRDPIATGRSFSQSTEGKSTYRTGDLGYLDAAGRLFLQGRADRQLQIRGVRIEPAEIEQVLEGHQGVSRVHCGLARLDADREELVAFVEVDGPVDASELATLVTRSLPRSHRPQIRVVDQMPLSAAGKVDTQTLLRDSHRSREAGIDGVDT